MTTPQDILTTHEVRLETSTKPLGTSADALVLGVRHDGELAVPSDVKAGVRRRLTELAERARVSGALDRVLVVPAPDEVAARSVVFTGLGRGEDDERGEHLRQAAGAAARTLRGTAETAVFALPVASETEVQAVAEGVGLRVGVQRLEARGHAAQAEFVQEIEGGMSEHRRLRQWK